MQTPVEKKNQSRETAAGLTNLKRNNLSLATLAIYGPRLRALRCINGLLVASSTNVNSLSRNLSRINCVLGDTWPIRNTVVHRVAAVSAKQLCYLR